MIRPPSKESENKSDSTMNDAISETAIQKFTKNRWVKLALWVICIIVLLVAASVVMKVMSTTVKNFKDLSKNLST